jgi:tRNA (mo5U34)-methyltransferase
MTDVTATDAQAAVDSNPLWYHTIEVADGVVTPGYFDLRQIIAKIPWPDVQGKRCLDVGTYDGQLAFELERRGASEVVATDIADHELWDWQPRLRARGLDYLKGIAGPKGRGFEIAQELLGSSVERRFISAYELSPDTVGEFDVVVCGSLLLHLRDPLRALEAIRSVCRERFLSLEEVSLWASVMHRGRPMFVFDGIASPVHWAVPNTAAHHRMLDVSGFDVVAQSKVYSEAYGASHPKPKQTARRRGVSLARRALTGSNGIPHHAILSKPAF